MVNTSTVWVMLVVLTLTSVPDVDGHGDVASSLEKSPEDRGVSRAGPPSSPGDPSVRDFTGSCRRSACTPTPRTSPNLNFYTAAATVHKMCVPGTEFIESDQDDVDKATGGREGSQKGHRIADNLQRTFQSEEDPRQTSRGDEGSRGTLPVKGAAREIPETMFYSAKPPTDLRRSPYIQIVSEQEDGTTIVYGFVDDRPSTSTDPGDGNVFVITDTGEVVPARGDDTTEVSPDSSSKVKSEDRPRLSRGSADAWECTWCTWLVLAAFIVVGMFICVVCACSARRSLGRLGPDDQHIQMQWAWS